MSLLLALCIGMGLPANTHAQTPEEDHDLWVEVDPELTLYVYLPGGRLTIALSPDLAQNHVRRIKSLVREGYYHGFPFIRVEPGFVSQAGDPAEFSEVGGEMRPFTSVPATVDAEFDEPFTADMEFAPLREPDEFGEQQGYLNGFAAVRSLPEKRIWLASCQLTVVMPRDDPDSGTTGIAIAQRPNLENDRAQTVFGRVIDGEEHALLMPASTPGDSSTWTVIDSVRVAADLPASRRTPYRMTDTSSEEFPALLDVLRNHPDPWFLGKPVRLEMCNPWIANIDDGNRDE
jgi:peptidylprolyl isomerase